MPKRVLITGASGFYGRHLIPYLNARGYLVRAISRRPLPAIGGVETQLIRDINLVQDWERRLEGIDAVVHLAAMAHMTDKIPDAAYDIINRQAVRKIAKAAKRNNTKFVFMSSIAAQTSHMSDHVLTESDQCNPTTAYGRAKLAAELDIAAMDVPFVILRPVLTYGAGVLGNMGRMIKLALMPIPPPFGGIRNKRSLLAIENMCAVVEFVLGSDVALRQILLVSDPEPISTPEIVLNIREGAGLKRRGLKISPRVLSGALSLIGRRDIWEKIGGSLIASSAKLESLGFSYKYHSPDALRLLGEAYMRHPVTQFQR